MKFKEKNKIMELNDYTVNINLLLQILHNFLDGNNYKIIHNTYTSDKQIYTTETKILLDNLQVVEQYGKGINIIQSELSGYAEILERVQLLLSFFSQNPFKLTLTFPFIKKNEVSKIDLNRYKRLYETVKENNPWINLINWEKEREKWIKVNDLMTPKKDIYLHYRFLYNSSGTASGKTLEQAKCNGILEIIERYCVGLVLLNQKKCPTIKKITLSKKNRRFLNLLKNDGIKTYIKDMSLNKAFPTIGLLCDYGNKRLHLHVGSGTSIDKAFERCLTELFQVDGLDNTLITKEQAHIKRLERLYEVFPQLNEFMSKTAYYTINYVKNGFISEELLQFLFEEDGSFTPWDYKANCEEEETKNLLSLLKKNDCHTYSMDYSWLGFPSLFVIIPELHLGYNEILYESSKLINFKKKLICNFDKINKDDLTILEDPRTIIDVAQNPILNMFFSIEVSYLKSISTWFFFGELANIFNLSEIAKKYLSQTTSDQLLKCLGKKSDEVKHYLAEILPPCDKKSCKECKYQKECQYSVTKKIQDKIIKIYPNYFYLHRKYANFRVN
jgi:YcaO-like protein with predicted kinase domain